MSDAFARDELSEAIPLDRVYTEDFDALILFVEGAELAHPAVGKLISEFLDVGKPVVASQAIGSLDGAVPRIRAAISEAR